MGNETTQTDKQGLEESWNEARSTLLKSLGEPVDNDDAEELSKAGQSTGGMSSTESERLRGVEGKATKEHPDARKAKSKKKSYRKADDEDAYDSDDDEEEEYEEDQEEDSRARKSSHNKKGGMGKSKSFSELMEEDEDTEDSMDAVPFLRSMVKSLSEVMERQNNRIEELEGLVKSHAKFALETSKQTEQLQKSFSDYLEGPVNSKSAKILSKGRFQSEKAEMSGPQILSKSHEWVVNNKIDVNTAGRIENRVNKGTLFQQGDELDQTVQKLVAQEDNS